MRSRTLKWSAIVAAGCLCLACSHLTTTDKTDVATYAGEQSACSAANPGDKAAIDACRAAVKAKWCAQWAGRFDAEVCQ